MALDHLPKLGQVRIGRSLEVAIERIVLGNGRCDRVAVQLDETFLVLERVLQTEIERILVVVEHLEPGVLVLFEQLQCLFLRLENEV